MSLGPVDPDRAVPPWLLPAVGRAVGPEPAVQAVTLVQADVWRLWLDNGETLIAKRHAWGELERQTPCDRLAVERAVLGVLGAANCSVPRFLGCDRDTDLIVLGDCGPETLDDWLQEHFGRGIPGSATAHALRTQWALAALLGAQAIERALASHVSRLEVRVAEGAGRGDLAAAWQAAGGQARRGLSFLLEGAPGRLNTAAALLDQVCATLAGRAPTLGSSDYNARNVVLDRQRGVLSFIEFSAVGWDWPERRLIQYTTSLGARGAAGGFVALLRPDLGRHGCEQLVDWQALDGHRLVFLLNAAARLSRAPTQRAERSVPFAGWANPAGRIRWLLAELAAPWSVDSPEAVLSRCFSDVPVPRWEEIP